MIVLVVSGSTLLDSRAQAAQGGQTDAATHTLIADHFNNRVTEVGPRHVVLWRFGDGSSIAEPHSVVALNDAERVSDDLTLIAGTGAPAGAEPSCLQGYPDNRVMLVNMAGAIVWRYGQAGITGAGANQLNTPVCAVFLPNGHVLITDQGNQRVIEVTLRHGIVWQYGATGAAGMDPNQLNNANSAELLTNGNVLIAAESNNRVIEVTPSGGSGGLSSGNIPLPLTQRCSVGPLSPTTYLTATP